jgi:hypothetical protein
MAHSTELKRLLRALDCLYYALLFSGQEPYEGHPEVWRGWVEFGFGTGLQQGPPVAEDPDRIRISTFSDGKQLTFTVSEGNPRTLQRWTELLHEVERIRPGVAGMPSERRVDALLERGQATSALNDAVTAALAGSDAEDRARVESAIRTALGALTFPIVTACRITSGV